MHYVRTIFLCALGASLLLWMATWWRTPALKRWDYQDSAHLIAFGPDGQLFVKEDHGKITARIHDPHAYTLVISPDGQRLATGGEGVVQVWDVASGQLLQTLALSRADAARSTIGTVDMLAFSPDGQLLGISAGDRKETYLWRVTDGQMLYTFPERAASIAFSQDGQEVVLDGTPIRVFRVADGSLIRQFDAGGEVVLSPDGQLLAVTKRYSDDGLQIFRYQDGALLQTFRGAYGYSYIAAFSPDSQYLATMYVPSGGGSNLGVGAISLDLFSINVPITLWRTSDWRTVQTFAGHPDGANLLTFSPDGQQIASAEDMVRLWRVAPCDPLWFLVGPLSVLAVLAGGVAWWVWARR